MNRIPKELLNIIQYYNHTNTFTNTKFIIIAEIDETWQNSDQCYIVENEKIIEYLINQLLTTYPKIYSTKIIKIIQNIIYEDDNERYDIVTKIILLSNVYYNNPNSIDDDNDYIKNHFNLKDIIDKSSVLGNISPLIEMRKPTDLLSKFNNLLPKVNDAVCLKGIIIKN